MDIAGKSFVFTGYLGIMTRNKAIELVVSKSGIVQTMVTRKTDFLVVGYYQEDLFDPGEKSKKLIIANQLITAGNPIQLLNPNDFFKLVDYYSLIGGKDGTN